MLCVRQVLVFLFSRTNLVFWVSKWRGKSELGLWMTSVLAKRMLLRSADFRRILRPNTFLNRKSVLHSGILFANTEVMHAPRSDSPLHLDIENTYQILTGKTKCWRLLPANPTGMRNFLADANDETSQWSWGTTHNPPIPFEKTLLSDFGYQNFKYMALNFKYMAKIQIHRAQTQICGAKIQIFDLRFKWINFCTIETLPLCTRRTFSTRFVLPPIPSSVLVKIWNAHPSRNPARVLAAGLPRQDQFESLLNTYV